MIRILKVIRIFAILSLLIVVQGSFNIVESGGNEAKITLKNSSLPKLDLEYTPKSIRIEAKKRNKKSTNTIVWQIDEEDRENDITLELEWIEGPESDISNSKFGFTSLSNNSEVKLPEGIIKIKINDGGWKSLDRKITVLKTGYEEADLEFKLNQDVLDQAWAEYISGKYVGVIKANQKGTPGNSKEIIDVSFEINEYTVLEISNASGSGSNLEMEMKIEEPVKPLIDDPYDQNWVKWKVNTNGNNLTVNIDSVGWDDEEYFDLTSEDHSQFFKYVIKEDIENEATKGEFHPGEVININNIKEGIIKIIYEPKGFGENRQWYELKAGSYRDKIKITVIN
jgi:hypothetical protein